jgi:hypothetical protein
MGVFGALFAAVVMVSCGTGADTSEEPIIVEVLPDTVELAVGVMRVYNYGGIIRLHAYQTNDAMKDRCFLLETEHELIGIETPAFSRNLAEYMDYAASLAKPLNHLIVVNHGNGGRLFSKSTVYSTAAVKEAFGPGGRIRGMIEGFIQTLGAGFDGDIPVITSIIPGGWTTIGGVDFNVIETTRGFDLEIPAINGVYTHMMGAYSHNTFADAQQIDEMLGRMRDIRSKNFALILTAHAEPESYLDVDEKISYLEQTKTIVSASRTRADFIAAMKAAFPDYDGGNYLETSARALFKQ